MRFLYSFAGNHEGFGSIVSPGSWGIPAAIKQGKPWAADNQAFTKGFNPSLFFPFLEKMLPYRETCLFVAVPDSVANWVATNYLFRQWAWKVKALGYPVAYVAQDGCEYQSWPPEFDCLFIGGSTQWKLSRAAEHSIKRAQAMKVHIHIGRVNYWKRYSHFRLLHGSNKFTCDGTRPRFERDRSLIAWRDYENQNPLFTI